MKVSYKLDLSELTRITRKMQDELYRELKQNVQQSAQGASVQAKQSAPRDKRVGHGGDLSRSIYYRVKDLTGEVGVGMPYGPYQDFGTGSRVVVPSGWESYAMQFKGAGIRNVNIAPQPFFYPAVNVHESKFNNECEKSLNKVMTKRR